MNSKALKTLEYDKIIRLLAEKCETPIGRTAANELVPSADLPEIERAQEETDDALQRIYRFGSLSMSGARDIRESLLRLRVAASLSMKELLDIGMVLKTADRVKKYHSEQAEQLPGQERALDGYFAALDPLTPLQKEIDRCILSEDEMADDASRELRKIRQEKRAAEARIHDELNKIVLSEGAKLRDQLITIRNGRYCLPVKNEYRSQFSGMIHDESGSGSTVFMEPMSVVRLNNEIREKEIEEQKEIERILGELSAQAAEGAETLSVDLTTLSHLDFVFAKASLAREMNASRPVFRTDRVITLKNARHPLLDKKKVVPIDVRLGDPFDALIVTGPNTGGKTVSLKTVGLLSLMGQAGLHIPADPLSELGLFTEIYADIGDEQSIEQSLSTFSSHMTNIIAILKMADEQSLVLFDELCAGTDPQEGAALAISILNHLHDRGIRTMATTHYSELKLYALSTSGVENASCEFNVATLSPTYRLLIGIPGKSNAFAISRKLGLSGTIIDEAKTHMDTDEVAFEDVIRSLDKSRRKLEKEEAKIGRLRHEARTLTETLSKEEAKTEEKREKILSEARAQAQKMLAEAKAQVDETIRAMNKAGKDSRELEKVRTDTRELLLRTAGETEKTEKKKSKTKASELRLGDAVRVLSMNMTGHVTALPDSRGNLEVRMGVLKSHVHVSDVTVIDEPDVRFEGRSIAPAGKGSSPAASKAMTISPEIKLIGMTVDEAMSELDKYLDDAYLAHLPSVRIVHGKGAGILREAVRSYLRKHPAVRSFRQAEYGEGDAGVTIAELKQ